jgi:hypothetical protein
MGSSIVLKVEDNPGGYATVPEFRVATWSISSARIVTEWPIPRSGSGLEA